MSLSPPELSDAISAIRHAADLKKRATSELVQLHSAIGTYRRTFELKGKDAHHLSSLEAMIEGELYERDQLHEIGKRPEWLGF